MLYKRLSEMVMIDLSLQTDNVFLCFGSQTILFYLFCTLCMFYRILFCFDAIKFGSFQKLNIFKSFIRIDMRKTCQKKKPDAVQLST